MRNTIIRNLLSGALLSMLTSCLGLFQANEPVEESKIVIESDNRIGKVDIFLYESSGRKGLLLHRTVNDYNSGDSLSIKGTKGEMTVVVIANYPYKFVDEALDSFDSIEHLQSYYSSESCGEPIMSGCSDLYSGGCATVRITPILCSVSLNRVEHSLKKYLRMEDPRIILKNVPESVDILRESGFRGNTAFSDTTGLRKIMWDYLPCDVGMYAQYPNTTLLTYPNEDELSRTRFILECEIDGKTVRFETDLPETGRGGNISLELDVASDISYNYTIRRYQ